MEELFEKAENKDAGFSLRPLAFRMRPVSLAEFSGQEHLLGSGRQLRLMIDSGKFLSAIFSGPPGCGKTALANIIASQFKAEFRRLNAVNASVKDIRAIADEARSQIRRGRRTVLLIDEIHRFSRTQQESLLPDVEEGNLVLIGLTTENPFYFIAGPLLSRTTVYKLKPLKTNEIEGILYNALKDSKRGIGELGLTADPEAVTLIAASGEGDARYSLNMLEICALTSGDGTLSRENVTKCMGEKKLRYDRKADQHYNTISAFIKSMRGSDPDAAVYYLARMISSGEDPRFIARRIAICASEDVGNADPRALMLANACLGAVEYIGMPEAQLTLAQTAIYVACAPKSDASCKAISGALKYISENGAGDVPAHLTKAGSKDYKYPHNYKYGYVRQRYMLPEERFYTPTSRGHEKYMGRYLEFLGEQQ